VKKCLFCNIILGEIPSEKVFEDNDTFAFKDINPVAPIHILVIPKIHISGLNNLNFKNFYIVEKIMKTAKKICKNEGIKQSGYRYIFNSGENGGQTVNHLHLHIIGGRRLKWPPG